MTISFSSPTDMHDQVSNAIGVAALSIGGSDQTNILSNFPTSTVWPSWTQLETAENLVRGFYDAAMNTARATGVTANVAAVNATWDGLAGFRNIFDVARETVNRYPTPPSS